MKKQTPVVILLLLSIFNPAGVAGRSSSSSAMYRKGWIDFNKNGNKDIYEDPDAPVEKRVEDLLSQMTMAEKTCQLATLYGSGRVLKDSLPTPLWEEEIWKEERREAALEGPVSARPEGRIHQRASHGDSQDRL